MKEILFKFFSLKKNKVLTFIFLALGIFALFFETQSSSATPNDTLPESADTYIPEGMVLIPIEIQNKEALTSMMGDFGIVDLYVPSFGEHIKSKKVASGVKIMRAPLNPEVYAVLVGEDHAFHITEYPGPFVITIQSPQKRKTQFNKKIPKQKLHVISEEHL